MLTRSDIAKINRKHLHEDESHKFPIRERFNVARRAIRQAYLLRRQGLEVRTAQEYASLLDFLECQIVNDPQNR
jgi:hypothetical protein